MNNEGTLQRLLDSFDYILLGLDFVISLAAAVVFAQSIDQMSRIDSSQLLQGGTTLTTSMVVVILTGISILVTMSDKRALVALRKSNEYKRFLFTFEFTALIALSTAVLGLSLQVFGYNRILLIFFVFLLSYSVTAIATVVSRLITYGEKVATIAALEDLPDDLAEIVRHQEEEESSEKESKEKNGLRKQSETTEGGETDQNTTDR